MNNEVIVANWLTHKKEYSSWCHMKKRCANKKYHSYALYGGRGITVCERWVNSFVAFFEDMGLCPSPNHTLDRINNDDIYYKENCRWATKQEQAENRGRTIVVCCGDEEMMVTDWARKFGLTPHCLHKRIRRKKDIVAVFANFGLKIDWWSRFGVKHQVA